MSHSLRLRFLRGALHTNVALLIVVFLLGMAVNLYLAFPSNLSATLAMGMPMVQFHMIVATLVLLVGAVALVLSVMLRHTWGIVTSLVGLVLTGMAYGGGMSFLNNGYQNSASMMMAIGFIGAIVAFGLGGFLTSSARTQGR